MLIFWKCRNMTQAETFLKKKRKKKRFVYGWCLDTFKNKAGSFNYTEVRKLYKGGSKRVLAKCGHFEGLHVQFVFKNAVRCCCIIQRKLHAPYYYISDNKVNNTAVRSSWFTALADIISQAQSVTGPPNKQMTISKCFNIL